MFQRGCYRRGQTGGFGPGAGVWGVWGVWGMRESGSGCRPLTLS